VSAFCIHLLEMGAQSFRPVSNGKAPIRNEMHLMLRRDQGCMPLDTTFGGCPVAGDEGTMEGSKNDFFVTNFGTTPGVALT
jgi:hypothetical protein